MIAVIVPYVGKIRRSYQSNDIVDRLNYQYTTMIITLAALTLAATQYVGKPIQCWVPAQFTGAWEKYTETYCFIKGSYFLPFDDDIPHEFSPRDDAVIGYYQWVPIMLALQAFLFYSPSLVWKAFNFRSDGGDAIDRLNYHYTAIVLMVTGLSLAGMLYTMHPIQCWVPAEFLPQWEHYAEVYCFTNGFYHMVEHCDAETTDSDDVCLEDKSVHVGYYQWLPLVAMLQAFMFAIPLCLWRINSGRTGINVSGVLHSAALVKKKFDRGSRTAQVHTAADHLQEALEMQRELKSGSLDCLHFGKRSGIYLIALYLFTKLLYVVNVMVQFLILNAFLGPQYTFWGAGILADIWNGKEWTESGHFPRVTLCDFNGYHVNIMEGLCFISLIKAIGAAFVRSSPTVACHFHSTQDSLLPQLQAASVRVLGNIHRWTVQCVLMINMFNEKIYIFLWWWFVLVGVLSVLSLLYYLIALTVSTYQRDFVGKYLRCMGAISEQCNVREERHLNDFVKKFLRPDGVFLLRLIETNGGDLLVGEIATALFNRYRARVEDKLSSLPVTESPDSSSSLHRRQ